MIKNRLLALAVLFTGAAGLRAAIADATPTTSAASPAPAAEPAAASASGSGGLTGPSAKSHKKTALEKQMDRLHHAAHLLQKQIKDPAQNASSLQLVATMRDAAVTALTLVPAKASDFTGPDRDKFVADYQASMKQFINAVDSLTGALIAGDNVTAFTDFQHLFALEKQDHKQYRKPEKH